MGDENVATSTLSANSVDVKERLGRKDPRLAEQIKRDRMFVSRRVDPVLGDLLQSLYIEQPQGADVPQFMLLQLLAARYVVGNASHEQSYDRTAGEYMHAERRGKPDLT